jgi:dTDP-4-amino-4,6-dideoxygalactose transaminase
MINVTKPFLPPREEYDKYIDGIWNRNWLTNNGPLVNELELRLKSYLGLDHLIYVSNGTIALQIAIKALELKGEVITTPFSYVATVSSIVWENCQPVFVDIDRETLNIDPNKIEETITKNTTAILATHVFGNPCDVIAIKNIADRFGLKVVYDAAHCFGTKINNKTVYECGDVSSTSFHATKLFHTVEGGALFTKSPDLLKRMSHMRNFGHVTPTEFDEVGINAKNSEFHAAFGLINLKYIDSIIERRKILSEYYDNSLKTLNYQKILIGTNVQYNYSYYPIILESEAHLMKAVEILNNHLIYPRRYFYPSLNKISYTSGEMPVSESISSRILCLPLYHDLQFADIDMIGRLLLRIQNNKI